MVGIIELWLPILLSSVIVFAVSSIVQTVSPWHKSDYPKVPDEDKVMDALRPFAIPPGDYMIARPSHREDPCSMIDFRGLSHTGTLSRGEDVVSSDNESIPGM
jgi:hypothetical protein